jgi:hypothetical protein
VKAVGLSPHHDVITRPDQVQIYEAVLGDRAGDVTHSLLAATQYLKDNRVPPRGFRPGGPDHAETAVQGDATHDANFNPDGNGRDQVTYRVPIASSVGPWAAEVALLYQAVPPEAVEHLQTAQGPAAKRFRKVYATASQSPETVAHARIEL